MPKLTPHESALTVLAQLNNDKPHGMTAKMWARNAKRGGAEETELPKSRKLDLSKYDGGDYKKEFGNNPQYTTEQIATLPYVGKMQNVGTSAMSIDPDSIMSISSDDLIKATMEFLNRIGRSGFPLDPSPVDPNIMIDKANPRSASGIKNGPVKRRPHKPIIDGPPKPIIQPTISLASEIKKMNKRGYKLNDSNLRGAADYDNYSSSSEDCIGSGTVGAGKGPVGAGKGPVGAGKGLVGAGKGPVGASNGKIPRARKKLSEEQIANRKANLQDWHAYLKSIRNMDFMQKLKKGKMSAGAQVRELVKQGGAVGVDSTEMYDFLNKAVQDRDSITLNDLESFMDALRLEVYKLDKSTPLVSQKRQKKIGNEKKRKVKKAFRSK